MPWESMTVNEERIRFMLAYRKKVLTERVTMSALCAEFGISRKTGYKFVARLEAEGWRGLVSGKRRPHSGSHWTDPAVCEAIIEVRKREEWGAGKILGYLEELEPNIQWPAPSTAHEILRRANLIPEQTRQRRWRHPGPPTEVPPDRPNQMWTTDFKGQFRMGDRRYCYPLTVADSYSRFLLGVDALVQPNFEETWLIFERLFREYGLPDSIRSDNGSPFASHAIGRLSKLSVRWVRLGIIPDLIQPGHPQQNGRHERMHRTLKDRATKPPGANRRDQQKMFDRFRTHYNEVRPHESLGQKRPTTFYQPSPRPYPKRLPEIVYPETYDVRRVRPNGQIKWNGHLIFVSEVLAREPVGFQKVAEDSWMVYFGPLVLGYYCERTQKLETDKDPA